MYLAQCRELLSITNYCITSCQSNFLNFSNQQGILQRQYLIDTTAENAQLFFHIKDFGNMTDADCTYGGLYINYEYPFVLRTYNSLTFSYHHGSTDNFKEKPRIQRSQLGPFCTRGEGFALVGLLNNIYINKGKTYIILYAFPPYFQIDLIFKAALTPCEGITNPMDLLCRLTIHAVVTPIYHLFCPVKRHGSSSMYIQKDACIVLQQAPSWTVQRSQLTIYSAVGMFTA